MLSGQLNSALSTLALGSVLVSRLTPQRALPTVALSILSAHCSTARMGPERNGLTPATSAPVGTTSLRTAGRGTDVFFESRLALNASDAHTSNFRHPVRAAMAAMLLCYCHSVRPQYLCVASHAPTSNLRRRWLRSGGCAAGGCAKSVALSAPIGIRCA